MSQPVLSKKVSRTCVDVRVRDALDLRPRTKHLLHLEQNDDA